MQANSRLSRLIPSCACDFGAFVESMALFEKGQSPPHMTLRDVDPRNANGTDYFAPVKYYAALVIFAHLGLRLRPNPEKDLREMLRWSELAFFGEWWRHYRSFRDQIGATPVHEIRSRVIEFWWNAYRYGLLSSLLLGDREAASRLGGFVGPDLILDASCRMTRPDLLFHCALGSYLRHGDLEDVLDQFVAKIDDGRSKRAKLWMRALQDIDAGDAEAFRSTFARVAADHLEREFRPMLSQPRGLPSDAVMLEGSILWHLANKKGIAPSWESLPVETSDRLLTFETATGTM